MGPKYGGLIGNTWAPAFQRRRERKVWRPHWCWIIVGREYEDDAPFTRYGTYWDVEVALDEFDEALSDSKWHDVHIIKSVRFYKWIPE